MNENSIALSRTLPTIGMVKLSMKKNLMDMKLCFVLFHTFLIRNYIEGFLYSNSPFYKLLIFLPIFLLNSYSFYILDIIPLCGYMHVHEHVPFL